MAAIRDRRAKNEETFRRMVSEVWNEGNLDLLDELFAEDYVGHANPIPDEIHGREGYEAFVTTYREAFPDLTIEIGEMVGDDGKMAANYVVRGTHEGALRDMEPTGREIEVPGMVMLRFEDGRCAEEWNCGDMMAMMAQLGVMPNPSA